MPQASACVFGTKTLSADCAVEISFSDLQTTECVCLSLNPSVHRSLLYIPAYVSLSPDCRKDCFHESDQIFHEADFLANNLQGPRVKNSKVLFFLTHDRILPLLSESGFSMV